MQIGITTEETGTETVGHTQHVGYNQHPVSYTHLDVYKRQPLYPAPVLSDTGYFT